MAQIVIPETLDDLINFIFIKNVSTLNIDTCLITDMSGLFSSTRFNNFRGCNYNQPLNHWDVSNVTNMNNIFSGALYFNQPLNDWDVSKVTDMASMFYFACYFNQPLDNWDVSNVTDMHDMFRNAERFNQPLDNWDVSNVTDMAGMFCNVTSFNQPLDKWDVSNVHYADFMFEGAKRYRGSMSNWNFNMTYFPYNFIKGCTYWKIYNSVKDLPSFNGKKPEKIDDLGVRTVWHKL